MKRFELRHAFPFPRDAVWAEVFGDAYQKASGVDDKVNREVLEEREVAGDVRRRIRITHKDPMPSFIQRWTGPQGRRSSRALAGCISLQSQRPGIQVDGCRPRR